MSRLLLTTTSPQHVEHSSYLTLEAMAVSLAKILIRDLGHGKITVSAEKPNAYGLAECAGVEISRSKADYPSHAVIGGN